MWLMTPSGFLSAVKHRDKPDTILVRARCREDLDQLIEQVPDAQPWEDKNADYLWRLECSTEEWASAVAYFALTIEYDNFKSAVKSEKHKRAYMRVWTTLLSELQGFKFSKQPHYPVPFQATQWDEPDEGPRCWVCDAPKQHEDGICPANCDGFDLTGRYDEEY